MGAEGASLVDSFLVLNPQDRLGASDGVFIDGDVKSFRTYKSVRSHPFCADFDWEKLESGEMESPYNPPDASWLEDSVNQLIDGATNLDAFFLDG